MNFESFQSYTPSPRNNPRVSSREPWNSPADFDSSLRSYTHDQQPAAELENKPALSTRILRGLGRISMKLQRQEEGYAPMPDQLSETNLEAHSKSSNVLSNIVTPDNPNPWNLPIDLGYVEKVRTTPFASEQLLANSEKEATLPTRIIRGIGRIGLKISNRGNDYAPMPEYLQNPVQVFQGEVPTYEQFWEEKEPRIKRIISAMGHKALDTLGIIKAGSELAVWNIVAGFVGGTGALVEATGGSPSSDRSASGRKNQAAADRIRAVSANNFRHAAIESRLRKQKQRLRTDLANRYLEKARQAEVIGDSAQAKKYLAAAKGHKKTINL